MTNRAYTYALIRFIPDPERMEPLNIGVVVQGREGIRLRLDNYFGSRKGIDAPIYKRWREFLQEEVEGEQKTLFRPSRESPEFWRYLRSLTGDTVALTPPMKLSYTEEHSLDDVLGMLYHRLVSRKSTEKDSSNGRPGHPAFEFRRIRNERSFDKRGLMKSHALKTDRDEYLWAPHRVAENGKVVAIDKIEVDVSPDRTNIELNSARLAAELVSHTKGKAIRWVVLVDPIDDNSFSLDPSDREDMKKAFEITKARVGKAKGEIISTPDEVLQFTSELESILKPIA